MPIPAPAAETVATPAPVAAPSAEPVPAPAPVAPLPVARSRRGSQVGPPAPSEFGAPQPGQGPIDGEGDARDQDNEAIALGTPGWSGADGAAVLLAAWLLGVTFFLARLGLSTLGAWWLVRRAAPVDEPALLHEARAVQRELGIGGPIRLVQSERICMPMAWGMLRPAVLLPAGCETWSAARRRVVLLHEMAHLKRRDCQTLLLARLVNAMHWFNPLAWMATRRLQAERERACDDLVLGSGTRGADYAQHLLDIARAVRADRGPGWATVAMARPGELEGRLLAILDPARRRHDAPRVATAVALLVVGVLVLPVAALQPAALAQGETIEQGMRQDSAGVGSRALEQQTTATTTTTTTSVELRALEEHVGVQLQRHGELQLDLHPRLAAALQARLPLELQPAVDGLAQGLGAGLGQAVADGLSEAVGEGLAQVTGTGASQTASQASGMDPRVMQAFVTALRDEDPDMRRQAANSLGTIESADAVAPLSEVLRNDTDAGVRSQAAWALGMIESDEAVPVLSEALRSDTNAGVRNHAAWALGMIESVEAVAPLGEALRNDADTGVRSQAAWALGMIESDEAVPALSAVLDDADKQVRGRALWALGMIESVASVPALVGALDDEEDDVRSHAAWALGMIEDASAVEGLSATLRNDASAEVRKRAAWALGMIEDVSALDALLDAFNDEEIEVRKTALWAVAQISG